MWECKYGKEPLDTRLCFLRLLRKAWLLLLMAVLGAALFGGIYFLSHVVYGPAREYKAESEFYIEYKNAVTEEQQYTFYNKETWESLIHTDLFMDTVMEEAEKQTAAMDRVITRKEVSDAVFATLLTDVRIVHVTVTTNSPFLTMVISGALEPAFVKFGEQQREIDEIRPILIPEEAALTVADNRNVQACVLGAVVFVCFTLFAMYLYAALDTSIYIPLEFERRFGIPMEVSSTKYSDAGDAGVKTGQETAQETAQETGGDAFGQESVSVRGQEDGSLVLYVKSGDHNRPLVEKTIRDLQFAGKTISKAILTHPDEKLIRWYFKTKFL